MRRTFPSCSDLDPTSIRARQSAIKVTPARPIGKRRGIAALFPSSRTRPMKRRSLPSSPTRFTRAVPASSRPSERSNASSASRYAARKQSAISLLSSLSPPASSWSNPSTPPRRLDMIKLPFIICVAAIAPVRIAAGAPERKAGHTWRPMDWICLSALARRAEAGPGPRI